MIRTTPWIGGVPLAMLLLSACADAARPGSGNPLSPLLPPAGDGVRLTEQAGGSYPTEADVPPERRFARVYSHTERMAWSGSSVNAYATMEYFGNRGEQSLEISVVHGYSTVGSMRIERHTGDFLPLARVMGNPLQYTVSESCGQTANLSVAHVAKTVIILNSAITTVGSDRVPGYTSASQPDCPPPPTCAPDDPGGDHMTGTDPAAPERRAEVSPFNFAYNPYDPGYDSASSGCDGGGYEGEAPPAGNPGQSFPELCTALGGKLYYDYGCIEKWNAEKGHWEPAWCGTYAVCET